MLLLAFPQSYAFAQKIPEILWCASLKPDAIYILMVQILPHQKALSTWLLTLAIDKTTGLSNIFVKNGKEIVWILLFPDCLLWLISCLCITLLVCVLLCIMSLYVSSEINGVICNTCLSLARLLHGVRGGISVRLPDLKLKHRKWSSRLKYATF